MFAFVVMVATAGVGIAWIEFMLRAMRPVEPEQAHGDVIELPAAARKAGGAAQRRSDGLAQGLDRTHSEDGV
jgi:hypothetical protein